MLTGTTVYQCAFGNYYFQQNNETARTNAHEFSTSTVHKYNSNELDKDI